MGSMICEKVYNSIVKAHSKGLVGPGVNCAEHMHLL